MSFALVLEFWAPKFKQIVWSRILLSELQTFGCYRSHRYHVYCCEKPAVEVAAEEPPAEAAEEPAAEGEEAPAEEGAEVEGES